MQSLVCIIKYTMACHVDKPNHDKGRQMPNAIDMDEYITRYMGEYRICSSGGPLASPNNMS